MVESRRKKEELSIISAKGDGKGRNISREGVSGKSIKKAVIPGKYKAISFK